MPGCFSVSVLGFSPVVCCLLMAIAKRKRYAMEEGRFAYLTFALGAIWNFHGATAAHCGNQSITPHGKHRSCTLHHRISDIHPRVKERRFLSLLASYLWLLGIELDILKLRTTGTNPGLESYSRVHVRRRSTHSSVRTCLPARESGDQGASNAPRRQRTAMCLHIHCKWTVRCSWLRTISRMQTPAAQIEELCQCWASDT